MKKLLIIPTLIIAALAMTSCLNSDNSDNYISVNGFVTAFEDLDQEIGVAFRTDYGVKFYVSQNNTSVELSDVEPGDRKVVTGILYESKLDDYVFSGVLSSIQDVQSGEWLSVSTEEEYDALPSDTPLVGIQSNTSLTMGYLNIYVGFNGYDFSKAKFYLVEDLTLMDTDNTIVDGYCYLELLVHNDESNISDDDDDVCEGYVSFYLGDLSDKLSNISGVMLRLTTVDEDNDYVYYPIDSYSLF
ncbi:MAG: NigD-like C-terminal domain-containing protein [Rikenellaceae bacterium]